MRSSKLSLLSLAVALAVWGAAPAPALAQDPVYQFNIPAQDLGAALRAFGQASRQQIIYESRDVSGKQSTMLVGTYVAEDALLHLLAGTGLKFERSAAGVLVVRASTSRAAASQGSATPAQEQQGEQGEEGAPTSPPGAEQQADDRKVERVVVTGTILRGAKPKSVPVLTIDAEELERSGALTVTDYFEKLPQNFAQSGIDGAPDGGVGPAPALNLRGLGANETLVLVNGRRLASASTFGTFTDISMIPSTAIDRVEVLLDGASATYGADAVGGVVNFILKDDFEGLATTATFGTVTEASHTQTRLSATTGDRWETGDILFSYEFFDMTRLAASERDFVLTHPGTDLMPKQRRHSFLGSFEQDIDEAVTFYTDGLVSLMDSDRDVSNPAELGRKIQDTELYSVASGFKASWDDWRYELGGTYTQRDEVVRDIEAPPSDPADAVVVDFVPETFLWSVDAKVDGSPFTLPGGDVQVAIGGGVRSEGFNFETFDPASGTRLFSEELSREVRYAYGEILIPLVGADNRVPGIEALELSLAGRYEEFSDFGNTANPKVGVAWSPVAGLTVRGSYSTSFRPPELRQLNGNTFVFALQPADFFGIAEPFPVLGPNVLLYVAGPNPELNEQTSTNYLFGFDYAPPDNKNFKLSMNYFDIRYDNKIGAPTTARGLFDAFENPTGLLPFYTLNPSSALVSQLIAQTTDLTSLTTLVDFSDPSTFANINLILDDRDTNLSQATARGIDFLMRYEWSSDVGDFSIDVNASYLIENGFRTTDLDPLINVVDTIFNPVDLTVRAGFGYTRDEFSSTLYLNYVDDYKNDRVAGTPEGVDAWLTADLALRYRFGPDAFLDGTVVGLNVRNLFDTDPPFVSTPARPGFVLNEGYDSANASPVGRFISFTVAKEF